MAIKVLGIEIGERLIKVCETQLGSGVRKVSGCVMFQTPPNAVVDGEIIDQDIVAAALRENLSRAGLKNKKVIFTISSTRIATREVTIPPVKENKIKALVEANAAEYFPVDMSKYRITYTLQEKVTSGENLGNRLIVMAAPLTILEGFFSLAASLGLQIHAIDYSGNSQFRLLETQQAEGVIMYVDVDSSYCITTVMRKNQLLMQRTFSSGVDDYVLAYMSGLEKAEDAEDAYLPALNELSAAYFGPEYGQADITGELEEYLSRLIGNITRLADYYNSSNWEMPVDKIVLTGAGAAVAGLENAVAGSTGLNVTVMSNLDKVSALSSIVPKLPQYISCLGCTINPVDLIPERFQKRKEKKGEKGSVALGVTILLLCIAGTIALSGFAYMDYISAMDKKQRLEQKTDSLAYTEAIFNNSLTYNKYIDDLSNLETALDSPNDDLLAFINELERKMPEEINILSASCTKEAISMNVTVTSKLAAAKTIQQLRSFESISVIYVGQLAQVTDDIGLTIVTFYVECTYVDEQAVLTDDDADQGE